MYNVRNITTTLLDMLFPHDAKVAAYDRLNIALLENTTTRTFVPLQYPCIAPLPYRHHLVRGAVHASKYHGHKRAAKLLGQVLTPYIAEELAERRMFGAFTEPIIIAIPLHTTRLRERGFNQAERIAESLTQHLDDKQILLQSDALVRSKNTNPQARYKGKQVRLENMYDAFRVPLPMRVQNKDIILLDDVVTTGATLAAGRKALLDAGARDVLCVAAAH